MHDMPKGKFLHDTFETLKGDDFPFDQVPWSFGGHLDGTGGVRDYQLGRVYCILQGIAKDCLGARYGVGGLTQRVAGLHHVIDITGAELLQDNIPQVAVYYPYALAIALDRGRGNIALHILQPHRQIVRNLHSLACDTNIAMLPVVLCQDLKQIKMRIFQRRIVKPSATLLKNEPHMVFYNLDISSDAGSA